MKTTLLSYGARALLALCLVVLVSCGAPPPPERKPPAVTVAQPELRRVEPYQEFTGTTQATAFTEVRARVSGELQSVLFDPASMVEEGQILFEIEPETYEAAKAEAIANLASAESELQRAQTDLGRIGAALESRAVSQSDFDQAKAARDQAHAQVLTARARLKQAELDVGYTRVQSPISGRVSRNFVDVGNLVGAGEATLLTTVAEVRPIFVYFEAPEALVLQMLRLDEDPANDEEELRRVHIATAADDDFPFIGQIDYIDNRVKQTTGTIELRAVVENDDIRLISGLFVRVRGLGGPARDALLVEERAISADIGGKYLLVLGEGNVVEQRYVELGIPQDDGTIVVRKGLEAGETYIVDGLLRARPGLPATPQTVQEVAAARAAQSARAPDATGGQGRGDADARPEAETQAEAP